MPASSKLTFYYLHDFATGRLPLTEMILCHFVDQSAWLKCVAMQFTHIALQLSNLFTDLVNNTEQQNMTLLTWPWKFSVWAKVSLNLLQLTFSANFYVLFWDDIYYIPQVDSNSQSSCFRFLATEHHKQLTPTYNCISRWSDCLYWPPWAHSHVAHIHTATHMHGVFKML